MEYTKLRNSFVYSNWKTQNWEIVNLIIFKYTKLRLLSLLIWRLSVGRGTKTEITPQLVVFMKYFWKIISLQLNSNPNTTRFTRGIQIGIQLKTYDFSKIFNEFNELWCYFCVCNTTSIQTSYQWKEKSKFYVFGKLII